MPRGNADYSLQGRYVYAPLQIYPFHFRSDNMKHEGSHTTNDRSEDQRSRSILEECVRRRYALDHRQIGAAPVQIHLSNFRLRHPTAKSFIRALLNPDPARRLAAERALAHTWLTSFAAPTEHDLPGLRGGFDPRARWHSAISTARALSCFANCKGAINHNGGAPMRKTVPAEAGRLLCDAGLGHQETITIATAPGAPIAAIAGRSRHETVSGGTRTDRDVSAVIIAPDVVFRGDQQSQNFCRGRKEWGCTMRAS
jgi:hypothetical protein